MRALVLSLALAGLFPLTTSAADTTSARRYSSSEALSVQNARLAAVLMVRSVDIKSSRRLSAGTAIDVAVGYGAAREVKGDYRSAARVAGGVIGGVAGTAVQSGLNKRRGLEVYVRELESGKVFAIVQADDLPTHVHDQVFLVGKGGMTRVVPIEKKR